MRLGATWYRWAVAIYDKSYRAVHGLDDPDAQVGPVLSLEIRRSPRRLGLADGSALRRGETIGILHLNNRRIAVLAAEGRPALAAALQFRRQLLASLRALAELARDDDRFANVRAFSAITVYHRGIEQLGFAPAPGDRILFPQLTGIYIRALLASLDGRPAAPIHRSGSRRARRLWISREGLLARYGKALATTETLEPGGIARSRVDAARRS